MSYHGIPEFQKCSGAYTAESPTLRKRLLYDDAELDREFIRIGEEAEETKWSVGQSLYYQIPLFGAMARWMDRDFQEMIKEWNIMKQFNIPPARCIDDCDAERLDAYNIISEEIVNCQKKESNG